MPSPGGLDDAAVVFFDLWIDELAAMRLEPVEGALLVRSHQPGIARHISGEDRCKTARCCRSYRVGRPPAAVPDVAVDEYAPVRHLSASLVRGTFTKSTIIH